MEETFEAYRTRLLSYLGDEEPIAVQQATSSQLDRRLRDVVPEQLIRRPAPENMRQKIRELNVRKRTQTHANTSGGHCPETQPNPPRMVESLWALLSDSDGPDVAVYQCHIGCVDDAQIQALCGTENTCESIDSFHCHQATQTVCTLASKQCRCVCLMGAG
jgi:hypothetical protein